jgi:hypothetical protein
MLIVAGYFYIHLRIYYNPSLLFCFKWVES